MTLLSPPASKGGQSPEDFDRRLCALFQSQMPRPWPPAPATISRRMAAPPSAAKPRSRWPLLRTRLALAASVALLATGMLFLAGAFQGRPDRHGDDLHVVAPAADARNDAVHSYDVKVNLKQPLDGPTAIQVDVRDLPSPMK